MLVRFISPVRHSSLPLEVVAGLRKSGISPTEVKFVEETFGPTGVVSGRADAVHFRSFLANGIR